MDSRKHSRVSTEVELSKSVHLTVSLPGRHRHNNDTQPLLPKKKTGHIGGCVRARHVLALLAFLGFFNVYCMRVNFSVALVAMINSSSLSSDNTTAVNRDDCPQHANTSQDNDDASPSGEFSWDANTQAILLGAFFYGCIVTQIPGGWVAERVGGKRLFGYGCLVTAVLTLLTPVSARAGVPYLVTVRVLMGMAEGVVLPAMFAMWGLWAPVYERSKLAAFALSGCQMGTVFAMPISGVLSQHGFAGGWPSVFYVFAAPTPWVSILRSPAVWGIVVAHFANNWGLYSLLTTLPTYMNNILHFPLTQNGILSGLPYLALWLTQMTSGQIADFIRRRGYLSTATTRKVMNTVGLAWPACFLVGTGYTGCDHTLAVVLLTLGVGGGGFAVGGYAVNHLDIAPAFAGTLVGITNGIATIPGFLGPAVVGLLTNHNQTVEQWRVFFFITGGIYLLGVGAFLLLARGQEQSWARPPRFPSITSAFNQEQIIPPPPPSRLQSEEDEEGYEDEEGGDKSDDDRSVTITWEQGSVQTSDRVRVNSGSFF